MGHNAVGRTNNWPVCSKICATRCQILRLKCTKVYFRWVEPQRKKSAPPDRLAVFNRRTSKGSGGAEEGMEGKEEGRGGDVGMDLAHEQILVWRPYVCYKLFSWMVRLI